MFGGQTMLQAKMRLDETANPVAIDYLHTGGQHKGQLVHGLFRWEGEDAVFAIAPPGQPRPDAFASFASNGVLLSRWRRKS